MVRVKLKDDHYFKGYRIKLYPTDDQKRFIDRCIELNRYIYNWALEKEIEQLKLFEENKAESSFLHMYELDKLFTIHRNENEWLKEIPHNSGRSAIRRLIKAYHRFFDGLCKYPVFKSKKDRYGKITSKSYTTRSDRMYFEDNLLRIEGLEKDDMIYTKYHTKLTKSSNIKFYDTVISKDNLDNYYISFSINTIKPISYFENNNIPESDPIGIDLNLKKRIVLSNGKIYYAPDISKHVKKARKYGKLHYKDYLKYSKEITNPEIEDIPYSNRAKKRLKIMQHEYNKIHNININFIHTSTKEIIKLHPSVIVMEDLDIKNGMQNKHYIASQIQFANFYKIREVMKQKCDNYDIKFMLAPKGYKSTQICSNCGHERKMYSQKVYICKKCGARIDRDINAAINLANLAMS